MRECYYDVAASY